MARRRRRSRRSWRLAGRLVGAFAEDLLEDATTSVATAYCNGPMKNGFTTAFESPARRRSRSRATLDGHQVERVGPNEQRIAGLLGHDADAGLSAPALRRAVQMARPGRRPARRPRTGFDSAADCCCCWPLNHSLSTRATSDAFELFSRKTLYASPLPLRICAPNRRPARPPGIITGDDEPVADSRNRQRAPPAAFGLSVRRVDNLPAAHRDHGRDGQVADTVP